MKADDTRPELKDELQPFRIESGERLLGLRHGSQGEFLEIRCELCLRARRHLRTGMRAGMDKKVDVERSVRGVAERRDLLAEQCGRQSRAANRAQTARIADCSGELRRCEAAHRRLDHGMGDAEQFEEIGAWPHEPTLRPAKFRQRYSAAFSAV